MKKNELLIKIMREKYKLGQMRILLKEEKFKKQSWQLVETQEQMSNKINFLENLYKVMKGR